MSDKSEPKYLVSPGDEVALLAHDLCLINLGEMSRRFSVDHDLLVAIVKSELPITPEIAAKLEPLGKPAAYWLELERKYQEDREKLSGISRWRKVEDAPPPKDGKSFFARKKLKDGSYDVFKSWWCVIKSEPDKTGWYHPIFNYGKPDGIFDEWCPIPA